MTDSEQVRIAATLLAVFQEGSMVVSLFDPKRVLVNGLPQLFCTVLCLFQIQTEGGSHIRFPGGHPNEQDDLEGVGHWPCFFLARR